MIENLRKYTGLIIVLFVLVIIGFVLLDTSSIRAASGGKPYIKVDGKSYSYQEYRKLGESSLSIAQSLTSAPDFRMFNFLLAMGVNFGEANDRVAEEFFVNRLNLQKAKEVYGIYPSDQEIDTFIRQLKAFSDQDGAFSVETYTNFIEKGIGRLGMTESDIRDIASDILAQEKIAAIIGAGLSESSEMIAKDKAFENQKAEVEVVKIDLDPIREKIELTEEEIKDYWTTVQDAYRTQEQRRFSYVLIEPTKAPLPAEIPAPAADATDEQKANHQKLVAERQGAIIEAQRKSRLASGATADRLVTQLGNEEGAPSFEALVKEEQLELKITELFEEADAPTPLNGALRASSSNGTVASELFKMVKTEDLFSKYSPAIATGENSWIVARLDETIPSRVKTFEEARDEARAQLLVEKSFAELRKQSTDKAQKIRELIKSGKTFSAAAKEVGITAESLNISALDINTQVDTKKAPLQLFQKIKYASPDSVLEPVIESDRAFILSVGKRTIIPAVETAESLQAQLDSELVQNGRYAFETWLKVQREAANVQKISAN